MTGKDLIIFILKNNLESESIDKIYLLVNNLYSIEQAAIKLNMGIESVKLLCKMKQLDTMEIDDKVYIYLRSDRNE